MDSTVFIYSSSLQQSEPYLHVVHEDLSCHAHLQHSMHYEFAEGCKQISSSVKVVEPLHLRALTD